MGSRIPNIWMVTFDPLPSGYVTRRMRSVIFGLNTCCWTTHNYGRYIVDRAKQ